MTAKDLAGSSLTRAAIVSVILGLVKFMGFILTGSLLLLASFLDSVSDAIISYANSYLHRKSVTQADKEHPFGHGGIEVIAGIIQGSVIGVFGVILAQKSLDRLFYSDLVEIKNLQLGVVVLLGSCLCAWALNHYLSSVGKRMGAQGKRSLSLVSDQAHYKGDALTNFFAAMGLIAVWQSGLVWLDAFFGLLGALALFHAAYPVLRSSFNDILHAEAPENVQKKIAETVYQTDQRILGMHRLRTRQLGPILFIDFHMKLHRSMNLEQAHQIGDRVADALEGVFHNCDVIIHLDPDSEPDDDIWTPPYRTRAKASPRPHHNEPPISDKD